jgi:hypothetical protein
MDTPIPPTPSAEADRDAARAGRKRWEAEKIAHARREAAAGHYITGAELDRWLDLYESTNEPVPIPRPRPGGKAS